MTNIVELPASARPSLTKVNGQPKVLETMSAGLIRVAVVGNVDVGKSTLIGTLTTSTLDDGKGLNRAKIAQHPHEVASGRTSSITTHLVGFDGDGNVLAQTAGSRKTWESMLAAQAERVVSLMDLAGHEKYFKTTISGLSRGMADYALVLVNSSQPPTYMTLNHLNLCTSCGIPVIAIMTKVDSCPSHIYRNTKKSLNLAIRSNDVGKRPYAIRSEGDIETVKDKMDSLVPVVDVSCVSGEGLHFLQKLFVALPKRRQHEKKIDRPFEFLVEEKFNLTGVGLVVSGFVNAGRWKKGDVLFIGPFANGSFIRTVAKSAFLANTSVDTVWAGHSVTFALALSKMERKAVNAQRNLVLVENPQAAKSFTVDLCLLRGQPVTMEAGKFQATVHILHQKRAVRLLSIDESNTAVLRPGARSQVTFAFIGGQAFVRKGMRVILRDGNVRGIGVVKEVNVG